MAGKYKSEFSGKEIDAAIKKVYNDKELSVNQILESSADNPINLDNLTDQEGKFTIYFFENAADGSTSGKPIELNVFRDVNGNVVHRYEKNGITMERVYNEETKTWSNWKPVMSFSLIGEGETLEVIRDTLIFRSVKDASEVTPILTE